MRTLATPRAADEVAGQLLEAANATAKVVTTNEKRREW
jgi:hypothetical protein